VPAPEALRSGVSLEVAIDGDGPLVAGFPTDEDVTRYGGAGDRQRPLDDAGTRIGYAAHARGDRPRDSATQRTSPPLTIGIKGPWGAGKTSLMRMVRERLEWPTGRAADAGPDARAADPPRHQKWTAA